MAIRIAAVALALLAGAAQASGDPKPASVLVGYHFDDEDLASTLISRAEIAAIEESEISVMPEGIRDKLTPVQLRDLFAYLQSK